MTDAGVGICHGTCRQPRGKTTEKFPLIHTSEVSVMNLQISEKHGCLDTGSSSNGGGTCP